MERNTVIVSTLIQNECSTESEQFDEAVREVKELFCEYEEAKWTQYTNSYLLKQDLEIIQILEESSDLETAKKKIIDVINRETGENYESP